MNTCKHIFEDRDGTDTCTKCGITFLDHARGFGSNVQPKKQK